MVPKTTDVGAVSASEMKDVYTSRMVPEPSRGRPIYDHIFELSGGRCPMCMHRDVRSLDHFLPKARYTILSVTPLNLIPCCSDCNKNKKSDAPAAAEEMTMHPYFDAFDHEPWLSAEVMQTQPAHFRFYVDAPGSWDATTTKRAEMHFDTFKLSDLYASEAANELLGIRWSLELVHGRTGEPGVTEYLVELALSRYLHRLNCWQTAMYRAMSKSPWFCSGGFR